MKKIIIDTLIMAIIGIAAAIIYNSYCAERKISYIREKLAIPFEVLNDDNYKTTEQDLEKSLTFEQMKEVVKDSERFIILDARRPEQYEEEYIAGAINIFPHWEEDQILENIFQLPMDKTVIIYCDGGTCDLSHELAGYVIDSGFERVFIYQGGWEEWSKLNKN